MRSITFFTIAAASFACGEPPKASDATIATASTPLRPPPAMEAGAPAENDAGVLATADAATAEAGAVAKPLEVPIKILARNQHTGAGLVADGSDVMWIDEASGTINRAPAFGGVVESLYDAKAALAGPAHLAADEVFIYWTMQVGGSRGASSFVRKQDIRNGGNPIDVDSSSEELRAVAVDATRIFWIAGENVFRAAKSGAAGRAPIAIKQATPSSLAVDRTHVYWTNAGGGGGKGAVMRTPLGASPFTAKPEVVAADQDGATSLRVDAANAFWVVGSKVLKSAKTGGPPAVVAEVEGNVAGIALDDASVYLVAASAGGDGFVARVAKDGGAVERLASQQPSPAAIAISGSYLYFTCKGTAARQYADGYVGMRPKP
jgi:hypothetical protein